MFFQELITYFLGWMRTRRWGRLSFRVVLCLSLIVAAGSVTCYGWLRNPHDLASAYLVIAEEEIAAAVDDESNLLGGSENQEGREGHDQESRQKAATLLGSMEHVSQGAELLLRRVLQLERSDRATFLVALRIGQQGRLGTARQMMRKIAPLTSKGFPAAHTWLATEQILSGKFQTDKSRREILLKDLAEAANWKGVSPELLMAYADVLASAGQANVALDTLRRRVGEFPELEIKIALLALSDGKKQEFADAAQVSKTRLKNAITTGNPTVQNYVDLSRMEYLSQEFDQAIRSANLGLEANKRESVDNQQEANDKVLRRLISESFRAKFHQSQTQTETGMSMNIAFLDQSLKIDPTNPYVVDDVAKLVAMGANATPEMLNALKSSLADGRASALTHLFLANSFLERENFDEAMPHLEQALLRAPDSPVILNNIALATAKRNSAEIPNALQMIEKALRIAGPNPNMLDTKGQILELNGDIPGAIICYEDAIGLETTIVNTRRALAKAYREVGMVEMANQQLARIAEIEGPNE